MQARELLIAARLRGDIPGVTRPTDFKLREGDALDPQLLITDPNYSLYCLDFDKRTALFVETPVDVDIYSAPFLYIAQYENATRLIEIPYETLHELAAEVQFNAANLILVYSIGRCGSTLVSHALGAVEGVQSLSEPDVLTQMLAEWGADDLGGGEKALLVRSSIIMQCVPGILTGSNAWAMKFRSSVTEMGPLIYKLFPEAKLVFLYRALGPWAKSFFKIMGGGDPNEVQSLDILRLLFGKGLRGLETREEATSLEIMGTLYVPVMEKCIEMLGMGIPMFIFRYEELVKEPLDVLRKMYDFCGLSSRTVHNLDAILSRDSQEGTLLSRDAPTEMPSQLSADDLQKLHQMIQASPHKVPSDGIIPGSYQPKSQA